MCAFFFCALQIGMEGVSFCSNLIKLSDYWQEKHMNTMHVCIFITIWRSSYPSPDVEVLDKSRRTHITLELAPDTTRVLLNYNEVYKQKK